MKYTAAQEISLLDALGLAAPDSSKSTLRSWIKLGRILVDGHVVKIPSQIVQPGQTLSLASKEKKAAKGLKIIYEDKDLVVIDKPKGLLSVSTAFETEETVHGVLKRTYHPKKIFVVHRLDQDTSGVMVFAFTPEAYEGLKKTFFDHALERKYAALVEGHLKVKQGTWESYLCEDQQYVIRETQDTTKGERAITHYEVRGESKNLSWLDITLETGKKNQIRVHCQSAGVPIIGDKKYGAKGNPIKRLGLHAYRLAFPHPVTGKYMTFDSPLPAAFTRIIQPKSSSGTCKRSI